MYLESTKTIHATSDYSSVITLTLEDKKWYQLESNAFCTGLFKANHNDVVPVRVSDEYTTENFEIKITGTTLTIKQNYTASPIILVNIYDAREEYLESELLTRTINPIDIVSAIFGNTRLDINVVTTSVTDAVGKGRVRLRVLNTGNLASPSIYAHTFYLKSGAIYYGNLGFTGTKNTSDLYNNYETYMGKAFTCYR